MIFEETLINYGAVGIFCAYLIYDKQVLMQKLLKSLDTIAARMERCPR